MGPHEIVLPLQCVGVLRGRGRPAAGLLAAGPQGCAQDVLLRPGPLPHRESPVDSCNAGTRAVTRPQRSERAADVTATGPNPRFNTEPNLEAICVCTFLYKLNRHTQTHTRYLYKITWNEFWSQLTSLPLHYSGTNKDRLVRPRMSSDLRRSLIEALTLLVFPLQIQRGAVIVGGAGLGGEVPAALCVGSHHVGVGRQSWWEKREWMKRSVRSPPTQRQRDGGQTAHLRFPLKASDWAFTFWR